MSPQPIPPHHGPGFFNRPWVQNVMPLATAVLLHVVVIGLGFALAGTVKKLIDPNKRQVIVADAVSVEKPGMPALPRAAADQSDILRQIILKEPRADGVNLKPTDVPAMSLADAGAGTTSRSEFAIGRHPNAGRIGDPGTNDGGVAAPFGPPHGGNGGSDGPPHTGIYTFDDHGNNVVYLCDCSGSMLGVFSHMKLNLKESINRLAFGPHGARQMFNVIFFSDTGPVAVFDGLQPATDENRLRAMRFIDDQSPSGGTIPLPAIRLAMRQTPAPQVIYVMTDGFDNVGSFDEVVNAFKVDKAVDLKISCIHFKSGEDPKLEQVLRTIAKNGGGQYKAIDKAEMN